EQFFARPDVRKMGGRFVGVVVEPGDPLMDVCATIESEVFGEVFGNRPEELASDYAGYDRHGLAFALFDQHTHRPVGSLRIFRPTERYGLKSVHDIARQPFGQQALLNLGAKHGLTSWERVWEIATVAVREPYRGKPIGHIAANHLYRMMYKAGLDEGV